MFTILFRCHFHISAAAICKPPTFQSQWFFSIHIPNSFLISWCVHSFNATFFNFLFFSEIVSVFSRHTSILPCQVHVERIHRLHRQVLSGQHSAIAVQSIQSIDCQFLRKRLLHWWLIRHLLLDRLTTSQLWNIIQLDKSPWLNLLLRISIFPYPAISCCNVLWISPSHNSILLFCRRFTLIYLDFIWTFDAIQFIFNSISTPINWLGDRSIDPPSNWNFGTLTHPALGRVYNSSDNFAGDFLENFGIDLPSNWSLAFWFIDHAGSRCRFGSSWSPTTTGHSPTSDPTVPSWAQPIRHCHRGTGSVQSLEMVQQDYISILQTSHPADVFEWLAVLNHTTGNHPWLAGNRRICSCLLSASFSLDDQHWFSTSLSLRTTGWLFSTYTIPNAEDCRWRVRAGASNHAGWDPRLQLRRLDREHPRAGPLDATKERAPEITTKGALKTKAYKRAPFQAQQLQAEDAKISHKVLSEESPHPWGPTSWSRDVAHELREDDQTKQATSKKGAGAGGPIGETECQDGPTFEDDPKYGALFAREWATPR